MRTANLVAGPQTDALVALARDWHRQCGGWFSGLRYGESKFIISKKEYSPSTTRAQWAELQQTFLVDVLHNSDNVQAWACHNIAGESIEEPIDCFAGLKQDGLAICKAVIAAKWGDEIPDEIWDRVK